MWAEPSGGEALEEDLGGGQLEPHATACRRHGGGYNIYIYISMYIYIYIVAFVFLTPTKQ